MPNLKIRQLMLEEGIKCWQVAKEIGITPYTFSVWMREDLTAERLNRVQAAINALSGGDKNG